MGCHPAGATQLQLALALSALSRAQFYFRTHRVVLGNRRWGAGGFVGNGRQQARAVHSSGASSSSSGASTSVAGSSKSANKVRPPLLF